MTDRETLIENLNTLFYTFWSNKDIDIDNDYKSIPTNKYNACMMFLYEQYVNTLEIPNNRNQKKYSYIDYINLIEWYIAKSLDYNFISLYGFALLLNRSISWLYSVKNTDNIINMFVVDSNNINNNSVLLNDNNIDINNRVEGSQRDVENATAPTIDATKKLFETIQQSTVNKLNDTPLGLVTNANNNKDIGLLYSKERIQEQAKARLTVSLADLPRLE